MNASTKAFPDPHIRDGGGMTLRQYYATAMMPSCIQMMNEAESYDLKDAVHMAFAYADCMIKYEEEGK
jgi:hypothetical protein